MIFDVVYTERAVKDIESLDRLVQKRIAKKIVALRHDPIRISKKLINPLLGTYCYRIGDYRVIFDIHLKRVVVLRVGHRKEISR